MLLTISGLDVVWIPPIVLDYFLLFRLGTKLSDSHDFVRIPCLLFFSLCTDYKKN